MKRQNICVYGALCIAAMVATVRADTRGKTTKAVVVAGNLYSCDATGAAVIVPLASPERGRTVPAAFPRDKSLPTIDFGWDIDKTKWYYARVYPALAPSSFQSIASVGTLESLDKPAMRDRETHADIWPRYTHGMTPFQNALDDDEVRVHGKSQVFGDVLLAETADYYAYTVPGKIVVIRDPKEPKGGDGGVYVSTDFDSGQCFVLYERGSDLHGTTATGQNYLIQKNSLVMSYPSTSPSNEDSAHAAPSTVILVNDKDSKLGRCVRILLYPDGHMNAICSEPEDKDVDAINRIAAAAVKADQLLSALRETETPKR